MSSTSSSNGDELLLRAFSRDPTKLRVELKKFVNMHLDPSRLGMNYSLANVQSMNEMVRPIFKEQKTLINCTAPIKIVGDIHAQYTDLRRIFAAHGTPPASNFVFLGDYVDRGRYSLETLMLLFAFKVLYPKCLVMLRGNHECEKTNRVYGFYDELNRRNLVSMFVELNRTFDYLPLAGLINRKILCMHGGISKDCHSLDDIKNIQRPTDGEYPEGPNIKDTDWIACDLLWADPSKERLKTHRGYETSPRGISLVFDMQALEVFCLKLKIECVVRGHQIVPKGFERMGLTARTRIITLFSAPNYCNDLDNAAGIMVIDANMKISFSVLEATSDVTEREQRQTDRVKTPYLDIFPQTLPTQTRLSAQSSSESSSSSVPP